MHQILNDMHRPRAFKPTEELEKVYVLKAYENILIGFLQTAENVVLVPINTP